MHTNIAEHPVQDFAGSPTKRTKGESLRVGSGAAQSLLHLHREEESSSCRPQLGKSLPIGQYSPAIRTNVLRKWVLTRDIQSIPPFHFGGVRKLCSYMRFPAGDQTRAASFSSVCNEAAVRNTVKHDFVSLKEGTQTLQATEQSCEWIRKRQHIPDL